MCHVIARGRYRCPRFMRAIGLVISLVVLVPWSVGVPSPVR